VALEATQVTKRGTATSTAGSRTTMTTQRKIKASEITEWFWNPGDSNAIDCIHPDTGRSLVNGYTLAEIQQRYPNAIVTGIEPILDAENAKFKHGAKRSDQETWDYMLNVLPPENWIREQGVESFKMSERTSGTITTIMCRIGENYFTLSDDFYMPHNAIVQSCLEELMALNREG